MKYKEAKKSFNDAVTINPNDAKVTKICNPALTKLDEIIEKEASIIEEAKQMKKVGDGLAGKG